MITVYGISNCDTIKRARAWLDGQGIGYRFHDYRKDGLDPAQLAQWADELGWDNLLNRRGTTWRGLPDADKADLGRDKAIALMLRHPAMIKRPLFDLGRRRVLGFDARAQAAVANRS